jgi:hypothetical protein
MPFAGIRIADAGFSLIKSAIIGDVVTGALHA